MGRRVPVVLPQSIGLARQKLVRCVRVIDVGMRDRSDNGQFVCTTGKMLKVFADVDAGDIGGDGMELTPKLVRGIGLKIPGILLGGATPHEQEDAAFRFPEPRRGCWIGRFDLGGPRFQQMRECRPE